MPTPFAEIIDATTGRVRVRYVDVTSEMYQTLYAYMIRLKPDDLADPARLRTLAAAGQVSEPEFAARFGPVVWTPNLRRT